MWPVRLKFLNRSTDQTGVETTAEQRAATSPFSNLPKGTETILIADDDAQVRAAVRGTLRRCGYKVLEASSGVDAVLVAAEEQGPIHLVLADVVMPGLTTDELENRLVALRPKTPIAFMSGYIHDDGVRRSVIQGPAPFLEKPFSADRLTRLVREVLDTPEN